MMTVMQSLTVTVTVPEAPNTRRPTAHHRFNPFAGAPKQNQTEMLSDHNETSPYEMLFTEFTEAVNENTDGISKHRLSPHNAHYLNYNFFTQFSVPVPYEYEI